MFIKKIKFFTDFNFCLDIAVVLLYNYILVDTKIITRKEFNI